MLRSSVRRFARWFFWRPIVPFVVEFLILAPLILADNPWASAGGLVLAPSLAVRASALAGVVVFFVAMRHGIGNWIQRRFFMSTNFGEVSLRDVREVQPRPMERRPVHFVATLVRGRCRRSCKTA